MLSPPTTAAVAATITALYGDTPAPFDKDTLAIVPRPASALVPNYDAQNYLQKLTKLANGAANSVACGSILAGRTSEADDFGDVAIWLGDDGALLSGQRERKVLETLELQGLLLGSSQVSSLSIHPHTFSDDLLLSLRGNLE